MKSILTLLAALSLCGCAAEQKTKTVYKDGEAPMPLPGGYALEYSVTSVDNTTGEEGIQEGLMFNCYLNTALSGKSGDYCGFQFEVVGDEFVFDTAPFNDSFQQSQQFGYGDEAGVTITYNIAFPDFGWDFSMTYTITHVGDL